MLKADGWRLFRLTVDRKKLKRIKDPAAHVRAAAKKKGLVLDVDGFNPSMPFRHREIRKDVIEVEQLQHVTGKFAGGPPEDLEFVARFLAGEAWGGVVKSATI